jgi:hypothetical protein
MNFITSILEVTYKDWSKSELPYGSQQELCTVHFSALEMLRLGTRIGW